MPEKEKKEKKIKDDGLPDNSKDFPDAVVPGLTPETITMTKDDLAALMKKTMVDAMKMFEQKQNDPQPILKQRVKIHTAKLAMWDGNFVVGFKNTQRNPDSKPSYFNDEFNPDRKRIEEYVTLIFDGGTEEKVCFLDFMNKMMPIVCKIEDTRIDKFSEEYTAITDPSFSGEEPKEVLLSTNYEKRTYTLRTPEMNLPDGTVLEPKQIEVFEDFVNLK